MSRRRFGGEVEGERVARLLCFGKMRVSRLGSQERLADEVDNRNAEGDDDLRTAASSGLVEKVSRVVAVLLVLPLSHRSP